MNNIYLPFLERIASVTKTAIIGLFCLLFSQASKAQMAVTSGQSAAVLAQTLAGPGIVILNPTLTCPSTAEGLFNITGVGGGFNLNQGIVLTTGVAQTTGNNPSVNVGVNIINGLSAGDPSNAANVSNLAPGDAQLLGLLGNYGGPAPTSHDACVLEFDFKPASDSIKFRYIFGSEEYTNFTCTSYNDVMGLFLSGPGIPTTNIATVPNTNIPVAINSINCGPTGGHDSTYCYDLIGQPPAPYTPYYCSYYINNIAGLVCTYDGLTDVLTARAGGLNPCDTYHLKIGVCDISDESRDSGVFLEQASFTSQSVKIDALGTAPTGAATLPYIVRGCPGGAFVVDMPSVQQPGDSLLLHYQFGGTAVNGVDYAQLADSSYVLPGQSTDTIKINTLAVPPAGPKTVTFYLYSTYQCNGISTIIDSATMTIYDSLIVGVLTPDTTVCIGQSVHIIGTNYGVTDTFLRYAWVPSGSLNDTTLLSPTATPTVTTTYTLTTSIPGSTCPSSHNQIKVGIIHPPVVNLTFHSANICLGTPIQLVASTTSPDTPYHYLWTPGSTLNIDTVANPYATPPIGETTYTVTISPNVPNCSSSDTVHVHVLPNDFTLFVHDSSFCKGYTFQVYAFGDTEFHYTWTPTVGLSNPNVIDPFINADTTMTYYVTATYPGCTDMTHQITLNVQPNPLVYLGGDRSMCKGDTVHIDASVTPTWYNNYQFDWIPDSNLVHAGQQDVIYYGDTSIEVRVIVTTQAGCTGTDSSFVTVHNGPHANISPVDTAICPNDSVGYNIVMSDATPATYHWIPDYAVDSTTATPFVHPSGSTDYSVVVVNDWGCKDTLSTHVTVHPAPVVGLPDSVTLYPGETYQMNPQTNCTGFLWYPPYGLSDTSISNPIASPAANTKYYILASTEWGCRTLDSISIYLDANTLLNIPNAFAPGSMGANTQFKLIKKGIANLKYFRIFNRWGEKMFETTDIDQGWDGTFKGQAQPMGVYIYEVEAVTTNGKIFTKQGNVTLIR